MTPIASVAQDLGKFFLLLFQCAGWALVAIALSMGVLHSLGVVGPAAKYVALYGYSNPWPALIQSAFICMLVALGSEYALKAIYGYEGDPMLLALKRKPR